MKFTPETIAILKNFATINQGLVFKPGNVIRTMHPQKSIIATATVPEEIEAEARVYDLNKFLAVVGLFSDPDVKFETHRFVIADTNRAVTYTYAAANAVTEPPSKDITLPSSDATFNLSWKDLSGAIKAAGVLSLPQLAFLVDDEGAYLSAVDTKNSTADTYRVRVSEEGGEEFNMPVKIENLKLLPLDYAVTLSKRGAARFESDKVTYTVALDRDA